MDKELKEYGDKIDWAKGISHKELAVVYKNSGEEEKARHEFNESANEGVKIESRLPKIILQITPQGLIHRELTEEEKKDTHTLVSHGEFQLKKGVELNLAHTKPEYAKQLFEWAMENTTLSEEALIRENKRKKFEVIAKAYLWRGYSLILLSRFEEACPLFKEITLYFNRYRKSFGTIYWEVEYNLPKALIPLCEYKLKPTADNKKKAINGLEEYIKSLEVEERLEGYIYYYHLKEVFPEAYSTID